MIKPQIPRVVIFAGPNGAGKSTHAGAILAALGMRTFVNAATSHGVCQVAMQMQ